MNTFYCVIIKKRNSFFGGQENEIININKREAHYIK